MARGGRWRPVGGGASGWAQCSGLGAVLRVRRGVSGWAHGWGGRSAWLEVGKAHPSAQQQAYRLQVHDATPHRDGETAHKQQRAIGDARRPCPPLHRRPHVSHDWARLATLRPGPGPLPLLAAVAMHRRRCSGPGPLLLLAAVVVFPGRLLFANRQREQRRQAVDGKEAAHRAVAVRRAPPCARPRKCSRAPQARGGIAV